MAFRTVRVSISCFPLHPNRRTARDAPSFWTAQSTTTTLSRPNLASVSLIDLLVHSVLQKETRSSAALATLVAFILSVTVLALWSLRLSPRTVDALQDTSELGLATGAGTITNVLLQKVTTRRAPTSSRYGLDFSAP